MFQKLSLDLSTRPFLVNVQAHDIHPINDFYHYHQGIELLYIYEGQGTIITGERIHNIEAGQLYLFPPYLLHKVHAYIDEKQPYRRTVIKFEPGRYIPYLGSFPTLARFYNEIWTGKTGAICLPVGSFEESLLHSIETIAANTSHMEEAEITETFAARLLSLFDTIRINLTTKKLFQPTSTSRRYSERIMEWLEDHMEEPFKLDVLSAHLHLTKHHVSRLFRAETGSSIQEYLISRRIRQACWLIHTTDLSIESVATNVGLTNTSYFCQVFKERIGCSPLKYRKRLGSPKE